MEEIKKLVIADVQKEITRISTRWDNLNEIIGGGLPLGRTIEVYGPSSIGKTSLALNICNSPITYFDLSRKLCLDYINGIENKDNLVINQSLNDDLLVECILDLKNSGILMVLDDLTMFGRFPDKERFNWLYRQFSRIQREIVDTQSSLIILNEIRCNPNTGAMYNPHSGCFSPALRIMMETAEKIDKYRRVYLNIEKNFWNDEDTRCTLIVGKKGIYADLSQLPKE